MSGGLIAAGMCGIGFSPSAITSAPVSTSSTPGIFARGSGIDRHDARMRMRRTQHALRAWLGKVKSSE